MRLPLATDYKTRNGIPDKDARLKNCTVETRDDKTMIRKRPGLASEVAVGTGQAQGGIGVNNELFVIIGDEIHSYPVDMTGCTSAEFNVPAAYFVDSGIAIVPTISEVWIPGGQNSPVTGGMLRFDYAGAFLGMIETPGKFPMAQIKFDATTNKVLCNLYLDGAKIARFDADTRAFEAYIDSTGGNNFALDGAGNVLNDSGVFPASVYRTNILTNARALVFATTDLNVLRMIQDKDGVIWFTALTAAPPQTNHWFSYSNGGPITTHSLGAYDDLLGHTSFVYDTVRNCVWFMVQGVGTNGLYKYDIASGTVTPFLIYGDYPDGQLVFTAVNGMAINATEGTICILGTNGTGLNLIGGLFWFNITTSKFSFCANPPEDILLANMDFYSGNTAFSQGAISTQSVIVKTTKPVSL